MNFRDKEKEIKEYFEKHGKNSRKSIKPWSKHGRWIARDSKQNQWHN